MKYTRVYAGADGVSHFEDLDVPLEETAYAPPAAPFFVSAPVDASRVLFCRASAGWVGDWHPVPHRQFFVMLAGVVELEAGDGERRRFPAGSVALLEDVSGPGHISRVVSDEDTLGVFVQLPPA